MEVSSVKGTISNGDVSHDFGKTILTVSPEKALSITDKFEQTLTITNTYGNDLYFYVSNYADKKSVKATSIYEIGSKTVTSNKYDNTCIGGKDCAIVGNTTFEIPTYTLIDSKSEVWGDNFNEHTIKGILIKQGQTKNFLVKYQSLTNTGKWNARVWANLIDDWRSIEKEEAVFDVIIDPSWSAGTTGLRSAWQFSEASGTSTTTDSFNVSNTGNVSLNYLINGSLNGNALYCNGSAQSVLTKNAIKNMFKGSITLWWYRNGTVGGAASGLLDFGQPASSNRFMRLGDTASLQDNVFWQINGTFDYYDPRVGSNNLQWNSWGITWNSTHVKKYVNGTLWETSATAGGIGDNANYLFWVCKQLDGGAVQGLVDELYTFDRELTVDEMGLLGNLTNPLFYPFSTVTPANYTVSAVTSFERYVVETNNTNFFVNVSFAQNVSNISNVSFGIAYLPSRITATQESNGTCGTNCTWQYFAVRNQRPPLNPSLFTMPYSLNWTYNTNLDNTTVWYNSTTNQSQNVTMAYLVDHLVYESSIIESWNTTWNVTYNITGGNTSDVSFTYVSSWNGTNVSGTQIVNSSFQIDSAFNYVSTWVNTTDNFKLVNITPYWNVTFNGTTVTRNGSNGALILYEGQLVYKMVLTNCSGNTSVSNTTSNQFFVRDIITDALLNANTVFDYNVWLYSRYNTVNQSRSYNFGFVGNSSPKVCIYPNLLIANYTVDRTYNASMTGYLSSSNTETGLTMTNTSSATTIYLTNASAVQEIVITVTDQNDNELTNYSVAAYLYSNGTYSLLDDEVSNLQGQVRFNLYIYNRLYQFRVYYPNGTLAVSAPTSGGATIISTSFTIKVYLVPQVTIANVIEMMSINHTISFNNVTGRVNLTFNDTGNFSSYNCLKIINLTNSNGSIIGNNCTANQQGTLLFYLGNSNGTFVAQYVATRRADSLNYLVDDLLINRNVYVDFQREGILWSFLLIGTVSAIGLYINPVLGIVFLLLGIVATAWIGILPIGWFALASIIAGALFVAFLLGRE